MLCNSIQNSNVLAARLIPVHGFAVTDTFCDRSAGPINHTRRSPDPPPQSVTGRASRLSRNLRRTICGVPRTQAPTPPRRAADQNPRHQERRWLRICGSVRNLFRKVFFCSTHAPETSANRAREHKHCASLGDVARERNDHVYRRAIPHADRTRSSPTIPPPPQFTRVTHPRSGRWTNSPAVLADHDCPSSLPRRRHPFKRGESFEPVGPFRRWSKACNFFNAPSRHRKIASSGSSRDAYPIPTGHEERTTPSRWHFGPPIPTRPVDCGQGPP